MALNLDHQRDRITTASGNITINTNGSLRVPVGNTAQRPQAGSVATGQIRFNSQTAEYEGYNGTAWTSLGGASFQTISIAAGTSDDIVASSATDTLNFEAGPSGAISITSDPATKTITIEAQPQYTDSDVDTHLNLSTATTGQVLSYDGADYAWISNAGYSDADVDTHLNLSTATTGQVLSYDGADYNWVDVSSNSITDADNDTHIKTETNADEDIIRFTTAGTERASLNATGVLTIGDSAGGTFYTFPTTRGTNTQILQIDSVGQLSFVDAPQQAGFYYQATAPNAGLNVGDLWFDTGTTGELYIYSGAQWISTNSGADTGFIKQNYTGNGANNSFDTQTSVNGGTVSLVFVNGVLVQPTNDYTETNGVITFTSTPLNGDQIDIMITGSLLDLTLNPLGLNNHNLMTVDASGELTVNSLIVSDLTDNRVLIAGTSGQVEDDANFTFNGTNLIVNTTGALQTPSGTTLQRPTPVTGQIRYNTDLNQFEGYHAASWSALGGGSSFDQSLNTTDDVTFNTVEITSGSLVIDSVSNLETASATTTSTTQTSIDSFLATKYRSCKYTVQITDTVSNEYQVTEILLLHDGTSSFVTTYGIMHTGSAELATFDTDVNLGNVRLLATSASANSTQYKITRISTLV